MDIVLNENESAPRTIHQIAKSQGISAAFISRLAVPLKRAGLIHALRGTTGGLRMAKSPDEITLLDITEVLDGPVSLLKCLTNHSYCRKEKSCPAHEVWDEINDTLRNALRAVTLSSVIERIKGCESAQGCGA